MLKEARLHDYLHQKLEIVPEYGGTSHPQVNKHNLVFKVQVDLKWMSS
jgi:hypothetical protein